MPDWLSAARALGERVLAERTPTTMGIRFPSDGKLTHTLYDGAAGVGLGLLELGATLADPRFFALSVEVRDGLVESTPVEGPSPGLYSGDGGVALFLLSHARARRDPFALEQAVALGERCAEVEPPGHDLLSGAAGAGLLALTLFHATGRRRFRQRARVSAEQLAASARRDGGGLAWISRDPADPRGREEAQPGLAHGAAGVALFLAELVRSDPGAKVSGLLADVLARLDRWAVPRGSGLAWRRVEPDGELRYHWCHGSVGVAHAYLAAHRATGDRRALRAAIAAGRHAFAAAEARGELDPSHCHGLAGVVELGLELADHGAGPSWLRRSRSLARLMLARAREAGAFARFGAACSTGLVGTARVLLRLGGGKSAPTFRVERAPALAFGAARRRRVRRSSAAHGAIEPALVPPVAIRVDDARLEGRWLPGGPPRGWELSAVGRALARAEAGPAYLEAVAAVEAGVAELASRYRALLGAGAISAASFGVVLREIAGLALREGADPARTRQVARTLSSGALSSLDRMLARLSRDRSGPLKGLVSGPLHEVELLGGDSHRGGERVVRLAFAEGPELLYKARSVAIDRELAGDAPGTLAMRARGWLGPRVEGGELPAHAIVAAGAAHGYVERVRQHLVAFEPGLELPARVGAPRSTRLAPGDGRRFYYSAGLLAGHAFALGISDLHAENVLVGTSRATPRPSLHAIDLEIAFVRVDGLEATQLVAERGPLHTHAGLDASLSLSCGLHAEEWSTSFEGRAREAATRPRRLAGWRFPQLAEDADGRRGYGTELCAFLRGMADQWELLVAHAATVEARLARLAGSQARVLMKPTQSYLATLERAKWGGPPVPGRALHPRRRQVYPLDASELRQLWQLDYPYFVRRLGSRATYFLDPEARELRRAPSLDRERRHHEPFSRIVERQRAAPRFARALLDAVRFVAPEGPFDAHDRGLGVRALRRSDDERVVVVVLLRRERITCRGAPDGALEWWID